MLNAYTPPAAAPVAPNVRYTDPALQEIYARVYTVLKAKRLPTIGDLFDATESDQIARQAVQLFIAAPESVDFQTRLLAIIEPFVTEKVRIGTERATSKIILGGMALALFVGAGLTLFAVVRKG